MIFKISAFDRGTPFPEARIASALNEIIQNSYFKIRVSLEELKAQKQDRFFRGRQIAYLIYDCSGSLASTILYSIMPTYLRLFFEMMIFRNSIRNVTNFFIVNGAIPT